jgi:hypothetical protein
MADESFDIKIVGLRETITALRKYEPEMLKALQKDMKGRLRPLATAVGHDFPHVPASLNGEMHWVGVGRYKGKARTPKWDGLAQSRVIISSSTGKRSFARVQQMSPSGAVFDSAKKSTTNGFIQALDFAANSATKGKKTRSRVMFGSTKKHLPIVEKEIEVVLGMLDAQIERKLSTYK